MIISLAIRDFVLIDRLEVSPGAGFTALTGETGAGKSIILDALALTLGAPADRSLIRAGADMASIVAEFAPPARHTAWDILAGAGLEAQRDESLVLKRLVRRQGPARAFINDQAVSAALLAQVGETLVEIHGQHAASALMRPVTHRTVLDQFAGNDALLAACAGAWATLEAAAAYRAEVEADFTAACEELDWLRHAVDELDGLAPGPEEAEQLANDRARLMQSERVTDAVKEAETSIQKAGAEAALSKAARATERICRLPGFDQSDATLPVMARSAAEAVERALIELREAMLAIGNLQHVAVHDDEKLEGVEARLFALRAAARKYSVDPSDLGALADRFRARLDRVEAGEDAMVAARRKEAEARAAWHQAAAALTAARTVSATRLETAIMTELKPLKLGRAQIRVAVQPLPEGGGGAHGADAVEFEAETNPGAGFGPLRKVASGGELARVSLALKCALAEAGSAGTLIFDEADQGVGGAVAAAIGERLVRLGKKRQVMAVTHSPQVAAAAAEQWLIQKSQRKKAGAWHLTGLNDSARQEEIARMLSGAEVTTEARAAAGRLLEDA